MDAGGPTASTAPQRIKTWGKLANNAQTTSIQILNPLGAGDFGIGSQMQVATATAEGVAVGELGSWVELGRTKLFSAGDTVDVANLPNKKYYMLLIDTPASGSLASNIRFGVGTADAGNNYASRREDNNVENTVSSTNRIILQALIGSTQGRFGVHLVSNLANKEKLLQGDDMRNTVGTASAPSRIEDTGKWTNVASALDIIQYVNTGGGNFPIDTEMVVLGWTPNDSSTTESNFWQPLGEQVLTGNADNMGVLISPKKYLWLQWYTSATGTVRQNLTFNGDTAANYGRRSSVNGAADVALTSQTSIQAWALQTNLQYFYNCFIRNVGTREKFLNAKNVELGTAGAATAPQRVEFTGKWRNTVSPIVKIDIDNDNTGDYLAGSFIRVWGHD